MSYLCLLMLWLFLLFLFLLVFFVGFVVFCCFAGEDAISNTLDAAANARRVSSTLPRSYRVGMRALLFFFSSFSLCIPLPVCFRFYFPVFDFRIFDLFDFSILFLILFLNVCAFVRYLVVVASNC